MITRSRWILPSLRLTALATELCILLAMASHSVAEELPKQANFTVTYTAVGSLVRTADLGDGTTVAALDFRILATNDGGPGLFHHTTASCAGVGTGQARTGYCVYTDKDGDKFLESWNRSAGVKKGTATLGPGTGKYKGIEGNLEWEPTSDFPVAASGTYNFVGTKRGSYRLP